MLRDSSEVTQDSVPRRETAWLPGAQSAAAVGPRAGARLEPAKPRLLGFAKVTPSHKSSGRRQYWPFLWSLVRGRIAYVPDFAAAQKEPS